MSNSSDYYKLFDSLKVETIFRSIHPSFEKELYFGHKKE